MLLNYYKRTIIDLLARVQDVRTSPIERRLDCLTIQRDLLRKVVYAEKRIKRCRAEIRTFKGMLSGKGSVRLSKSEALRTKKAVKCKRQAIEEYKEILYLLKSIGDALAFIYIPKWDIKPMAFKEDSGYIHGKDGLRQELTYLEKVYEVDGALAILNDVTNSLRYGDLTIVSNGYCGPIEVKSGRHENHRVDRQLSKLEKMHRYIVEDRIEGLYGLPGEVVRSDIRVEERNYVGDLNDLVAEAYEHGFAFAKVEEGLYYYVCYDGHPASWDPKGDMPGGFNLLIEEFKGKEPMLFFINRNKFDTQGRYPYTLSITNPLALFDFYSGRLHVNVILDIAAISTKFEHHGMEATLMDDGDVALILVNKDPAKANDRWDMFISRHFFERVAYEFLSLDWFVEENARRVEISTYTEQELSVFQVSTDGDEILDTRLLQM